jgi:hypothetical protein
MTAGRTLLRVVLGRDAYERAVADLDDVELRVPGSGPGRGRRLVSFCGQASIGCGGGPNPAAARVI